MTRLGSFFVQSIGYTVVKLCLCLSRKQIFLCFRHSSTFYLSFGLCLGKLFYVIIPFSHTSYSNKFTHKLTIIHKVFSDLEGREGKLIHKTINILIIIMFI